MALYTRICTRIVSNGSRRRFSQISRQLDRPSNNQIDVEAFLSKPTWSVASLLPPKDSKQELSSKQLHHLLRLSALPPPVTPEEEQRMLSTLSSQLHFVKEIQKVDTTSVHPLRSLRDETAQGEKEAEIGMEQLKEAFDMEEIRGRHHKRIRRKNKPKAERSDEQWNVLGTAERQVGRYFVVEGGKDG